MPIANGPALAAQISPVNRELGGFAYFGDGAAQYWRVSRIAQSGKPRFELPFQFLFVRITATAEHTRY